MYEGLFFCDSYKLENEEILSLLASSSLIFFQLLLQAEVKLTSLNLVIDKFGNHSTKNIISYGHELLFIVFSNRLII